jgi:hypothetical protein
MPADPQQTIRLHQLHDEYVWKVNAAVAEGREELIRRLSDEYVDEAVRILAEGSPATACAREACEACARPRPVPPPRRRRCRWLELLVATGVLARSRQR